MFVYCWPTVYSFGPKNLAERLMFAGYVYVAPAGMNGTFLQILMINTCDPRQECHARG